MSVPACIGAAGADGIVRGDVAVSGELVTNRGDVGQTTLAGASVEPELQRPGGRGKQ